MIAVGMYLGIGWLMRAFTSSAAVVGAANAVAKGGKGLTVGTRFVKNNDWDYATQGAKPGAFSGDTVISNDF